MTHTIAAISFGEGIVACRCGWRSTRGLGCGELVAVWRAHRVAVGVLMRQERPA